MREALVCEIAGRLMRQPAAPYAEHLVAAEVIRICREHRLDYTTDSLGNILVRLRIAPRQRVVALSAHMDHPGFSVLKRMGPSKVVAEFLGGVPDQFFRPGIRVRLLPGGVTGRLGAPAGKRRFELNAPLPLPEAPRFAVWELEDFRLRQGRIIGRSCDDLVGVASALSTLIALKKMRAKVNALALITRAEEVGFQGALGLIARRTVPQTALVISLETSRELPPVKMGSGVIIRVGDRSSIFDSLATRYLTEVANELKGFAFQRALMSGGTCEGTAYQEAGYQTAAVCVALGNYHNCAPKNKIRAEYVSASDAESMVQLLVESVRRIGEFDALTGKLRTRLRDLAREGERKLLLR